MVNGSSREVLGLLCEIIRAFPDDRATISHRERVELAVLAATFISQAQGLGALLVAEADEHNSSLRTLGTPSATVLANEMGVSGSQAAGMVHAARRLASTPVAHQAVVDGTISYTHGTAVSRAMESMPASFTAEQTAQAEVLLVDVASHSTPDRVLRAVPTIVEQLAPGDADELQARRLTRERDAAWRERSLSWSRDRGSLVFKGSLPLLEGEAFTTLVTAYAQHARRKALDTHDPLAGQTTMVQRHADALMRLVEDAGHHTAAPTLAGDRPVVTVTVDYDKLTTGAAGAGVLPSGQPLSAGDLRRVCCDATLIPVVLGSTSEPLDVGRANRLVTPEIRKALTIRDEHCAFPTCDTPATHCDAHHITPWWQGGTTTLDNLVLLCPHHHGLIEPDPHAARDQWTVTIPPGGHPVVTPPRRYQEANPPGNAPPQGP